VVKVVQYDKAICSEMSKNPISNCQPSIQKLNLHHVRLITKFSYMDKEIKSSWLCKYQWKGTWFI